MPYAVTKVRDQRANFREYALDVAPLAASVANYCDHVEHNEAVATGWITDAGTRLSELAMDLAATARLDLVTLYADRLGAIEARNVLAGPGAYDGRAAALSTGTWRELQLVQVEHDRYYHPDIVGLPKFDQLRHCSLHLTKIVGAFAEAADPDELLHRRLPDSLLFALKLHTVMGKRLPDDALPRSSGDVARTATV